MMKVALVSYDFPEYCIQQANGLARAADILLMLPEGEAEEYRHALDRAVRFHTFVKPRLRQPIRQLTAISGMLRQIRRFHPDVIHFQHGHLWFNLALPLLRGYPIVVTVHDPAPHAGDCSSQKTPHGIMKLGYRRADHLIVHGQQIKREVVHLLRTPAGRVHSIPHIAIGKADDSWDAVPAANRILFFGRIWEYKGLDYLIEAEPLITREIPDATIEIAGEGEDFGRYRRLMAHPDRFIVHNRYISVPERIELFRRASLVALPYVEATQSGVIPVAYSFGRPVVATRVGALAEAVDEGRTGLLVRPRDPKALARAVVDLLRDPVRLKQMGAAARRKLDDEWSPQVVARQTLQVYQQAIEDRVKRRFPRTAPFQLVPDHEEGG
jgi:glycosyltransferase involved in cell wall biosynthesis